MEVKKKRKGFCWDRKDIQKDINKGITLGLQTTAFWKPTSL